MNVSLAHRRWTLPPPAGARAAEIAQELAVPAAVARLLAARGVASAQQAAAFLDPPPPGDLQRLPGLRAAVERLMAAEARGQRVLVYGDYDCDGVCSAALAAEALGALGLGVAVHLPARADGYGMRAATLPALAVAAGCTLVLAVDNGSTAHDAIAAARRAGLDVIVADHHQCESVLPPAVAVVNPILEPDSPGAGLAGVGVTWCLAQALAAALGRSAPPSLDLVALGTIADVAPLVGWNRWLARAGLAAMSDPALRPGMAALLAACGVPRGARPSVRDLSHGLAPRINAPGRVDRPHAAYDLLMARDAAHAGAALAEVEVHNRQRQELGDELTASAEAAAATLPRGSRAVVLADTGWHPGLVGLAASRLSDHLGVPVLLAAIDAEGRCRGSGRGPDGWDLTAALRQCAHLLLRFGGHAQAAGFELQVDRLPALREALGLLAPPVAPEGGAVRERVLDGEICGAEVDLALARALERLGPFGEGNPEPAFLLRGAAVEAAHPVGRQERHVRLRLRLGPPPGGGVADAVGFGLGTWTEGLVVGGPFDFVVRPEVDRYRRREAVQLVVEDALPADGDWTRLLSGTRSALRRRHPDRDDLASAFRRLRALARGGPLPPNPTLLRELAPGCVAGEPAAEAALVIFRELELLDAEGRLQHPADGGKVNLDGSARFRASEAARRALHRLEKAAADAAG